jgi:hypothetical protein
VNQIVRHPWVVWIFLEQRIEDGDRPRLVRQAIDLFLGQRHQRERVERAYFHIPRELLV